MGAQQAIHIRHVTKGSHPLLGVDNYSRGKGRELACVIGRCTRWSTQGHTYPRLTGKEGNWHALLSTVARWKRGTHGEKEGNWGRGGGFRQVA